MGKVPISQCTDRQTTDELFVNGRIAENRPENRPRDKNATSATVRKPSAKKTIIFQWFFRTVRNRPQTVRGQSPTEADGLGRVGA